MRKLTTADWDKACEWLEEKAARANGQTPGRKRKPKGLTPTEERKAAMERAGKG